MNIIESPNLPEDLRRSIFKYVSHPVADLIRHINWKKEYIEEMLFQLHSTKTIRANLSQYHFNNVFGHITSFSSKPNKQTILYDTNQRLPFCCLDMRYANYGLCCKYSLDRAEKYCIANRIPFKGGWNKKQFMKAIIKFDDGNP